MYITKWHFLAEACYSDFIVNETTHTFIVHAITNVKYVYCEVNRNDETMNAAEPEYFRAHQSLPDN